MSHTELCETAQWNIDLDIRDENGPVDMTGLSCVFVVTMKNGVEVQRAATSGVTGGAITAVTGPTGTGRSRLQVVMDTQTGGIHGALSVTGAFVLVDADLGVMPGPKWLGKKEFVVKAGPAWTGPTGA